MKTSHYITTISVALVSGSLAVLGANAASSQTSAKTHAAAAMKAAAAPSQGSGVWFGAIAENIKAAAGSTRHGQSEVRIVRVFKDSPAYAAGLRKGDILWNFDSQRLQNTAQLEGELHGERPGAVVPLQIYRHGERENLKVTLGARHGGAEMPPHA
ncbi:MAG TPA: PDZ domain-containing protein [Verrucomicrobiales bacterium]|jgi:S1-C subfamily serine protease|nr:PDZ domain-containing protein [Verrucomicrobiales bacterium]